MTGPSNGTQPHNGKGKSTHDDDSTLPSRQDASSASTNDTNDISVISKITQSAASLGRDLLSARPSGGELGSLASTAAGSKAASSSSARGASLSGPAYEPSGSSQGSAHTSAVSAPSGGFRSHAQQHSEEQEKAFSQFLDGTSVDLSIPEQPLIGADLSTAEDAWTRAQSAQPVRPTQAAPQSLSDVAIQQMHDGIDVVNLLSANGPPEEEPNYDDIELAEDEATALKHALFGGGGSSSSNGEPVPATRTLEWDSVLNFIPDFVRPDAAGGYEGAAASSASIKSHETRAALGMAHSPEATRAWLDQWHSVLTRYDDEVWGGLTPLVVQAREEVDQQLKETDDVPSQPASTKALDRLRQILGHLRDE